MKCVLRFHFYEYKSTLYLANGCQICIIFFVIALNFWRKIQLFLFDKVDQLGRSHLWLEKKYISHIHFT